MATEDKSDLVTRADCVTVQLPEHGAGSSAPGYQRLFRAASEHDRFGALGRYSNPNVRFPAAFVRFNPQSGPDAGGPSTAAVDPKEK